MHINISSSKYEYMYMHLLTDLTAGCYAKYNTIIQMIRICWIEELKITISLHILLQGPQPISEGKGDPPPVFIITNLTSSTPGQELIRPFICPRVEQLPIYVITELDFSDCTRTGISKLLRPVLPLIALEIFFFCQKSQF